MELKIRKSKADDLNFILSTWLRNYRHSSTFAQSIRTSIFYEWHHKVIMRIIERGATVNIACDPTDENFVFGYSVTEGPVLHYVYIKKSMRGLGVAKKLLDGITFTEFTHLNQGLGEWLKKHPEVTYNPYKV